MTREEAIRIISKALERAENEEIGDAYMYIVECGLCPVEGKCNNANRICRDFITEEISEEV